MSHYLGVGIHQVLGIGIYQVELVNHQLTVNIVNATHCLESTIMMLELMA